MRLEGLRLIFSDSSFIHHLLLRMMFQASFVQSSTYINPSVEGDQILPKIDFESFVQSRSYISPSVEDNQILPKIDNESYNEDIIELDKHKNNIFIFCEYFYFDPFLEVPNVEIDSIVTELKEFLNENKRVWFYINEEDVVRKACQVIMLNIEKKIKGIEDTFADLSFTKEPNETLISSTKKIEEYKKYLDFFTGILSKMK